MAFGLSYVAAHLGISIPPLGLRKETFGHIIITNVGGMGFQSAHAPLCPVVHAMGLVCIGATTKRPTVDKKTGELIAADMMTMVATGDHRYGDAAIWVPLFNMVRAIFEDPENFDETKVKGNVHYSELEA